MRGTILYGPYDVRSEERADPKIIESTDAIIKMIATCVCGSDLWPYRGIALVTQPTPMGHEYCGIVEEVGSQVTSIKPGQFVIGSFFASDNTCAICQAGYQSRCVDNRSIGAEGAQAEWLRVPLADCSRFQEMAAARLECRRESHEETNGLRGKDPVFRPRG